VPASLLEGESRSGHEVLDRSGDEHLTWPGEDATRAPTTTLMPPGNPSPAVSTSVPRNRVEQAADERVVCLREVLPRLRAHGRVS
jgi:hypothetical protein